MTTNSLLMTCCVIVSTPNGLYLQARAILDSASSASFISERLARSLHLPFIHRVTSITGIATLTCGSTTHSVTTFSGSAVSSLSNQITITAVVIPKVSCDLPVNPVPRDSSWKHIEGIQLADPEFSKPGRVYILLDVDVFVNVLWHGQRIGPLDHLLLSNQVWMGVGW